MTLRVNGSAPHSPIFDELRAVQRRHGYLPEAELRTVAARLDLPLYRVQSVASFYPHFYLRPPARAEVRVCGDMACHRYRAAALREALPRRVQGQDVNVTHVSCLGRCDVGPAISVNDRIYERVSEADAAALITTALGGQPLPPAAHHHHGVVTYSDPYDAGARYGMVRKYVESRDWTGLIATLKDSGLRGLGGAGFPTGMKWELVRNQPGAEKYIVCNADESEPGTIKDRHIMTSAPHLLIEGIVLGGLVAGARHGIIYIRHEYPDQEHILQREIDRCYAAGILGPSVLGSDLA